jgi:hypothetical protein
MARNYVQTVSHRPYVYSYCSLPSAHIPSQTASGASSASVTMAAADVRLLFADTMLGPLGALRPKAGEAARDLFDQVCVHVGRNVDGERVVIAIGDSKRVQSSCICHCT